MWISFGTVHKWAWYWLHNTKYLHLQTINFHYTCIKSTQRIKAYNLDLDSCHTAVSVSMVSTLYCAECDEHWFYRHQSDKNTVLENFQEIVWKPRTLSDHFHYQWTWRIFQCPLCPSCTLLSPSNLSLNLEIATNVGNSVSNYFFRCLCISFTASVF